MNSSNARGRAIPRWRPPAALASGAVLLGLALRAAGVEVVAAGLTALVVVLAIRGVLVLRTSTCPAPQPAALVRTDVVAVAGGLFAVFAAWIVANSLLTPSIRTAVNGPDATSGYSPLLVLVLLVSLPLAAAPLLLTARRAPRRAALPAVLIGLLVIKVVIGLLLLKVPPFDAGSVFLAAYGDVVPSAADYPFDRSFADFYFSIYPNNLTLAWILSLVFRVVALTGVSGFANYALAGVLLNCAVLTLTELLTFRVVHRLWGPRAAWAALVVTAMFTTLSPWVNTPYSDTLGSVFPIGIVAMWGWLRAARTSRALLVRGGLLGAVAALGIAVKPTVLFVVLAVVAVDAVRHRRALLRRVVARSVISVIAVGCASGIAFSLGSTAVIGISGLTTFDVWTNRNAFPVAHFLKMGATGTGGFNGDDFNTTSQTAPDDRTAQSIGVYLQRVGAMGPEGYAIFLGEKALRTFGDGSFGQGAEGDPFPAYVLDDPGSVKFREWYTRGAPHHVSLASFWQASWLLLLAACAIPGGRFATGPRRRTLDSARLSVLALLVFLLLFETRSRYVYLDVPLLVVAAVGAASGAPALLARLRSTPLRQAFWREHPWLAGISTGLTRKPDLPPVADDTPHSAHKVASPRVRAGRT